MSHECPVLDFSNLTHQEICVLLQRHQLTLDPEEALYIQTSILKRPPTIAECHLWTIQGSEHCSYKSSRKYLQQLPTDGPNVILGPKEDAGVIAVAMDNQGRRYGVAMSHESHNHPSQIVPYEGAATGVGGNLRDVCCMGAEVIAVADSLRFGSLEQQKTHWIYEGVIAGISGYGNAVGIPNLTGDVYFDPAYNDNCLVTLVTLGIVREDQIIHSYVPKNAEDYVYILVGKATDNSGFGGASFASANMANENQQQNKGAVQEPNAFLKRHLLKANYALFERLKNDNLVERVGFKDLGAGGVACATVEMAEAGGYGAEVEVEAIPSSMDNLPPHVLLCSETQERFMWAVPPELVDLILEHYNQHFALPEISHGACAAVIGKIRSDQQYVVYYEGKPIINARASDITRGIVYDRALAPKKICADEEPSIAPQNANTVLMALLSHENIASRAPIIETYDKQVQGRTLLEAGEADAGVLTPFNEEQYPEEIRHTGIALSLDHNPRYNQIDPYWGAVNAVIESARNVAAVGATPVALTDCLCFGNPENPERMWEFSEAIRGIKDACKAIGVKEHPGNSLPVISGNVSFYNESDASSIPPSPMIACLGRIQDAGKAISAHFKEAEHDIVLIGERKNECGGSVYYSLQNILGNRLPKPDLTTIGAELHALTDAIAQELIISAHDISEGGIAVALAEMSFKNNIGVNVHLAGELPDDIKLFSESGGFILEVNPLKTMELKNFFQQRNIASWCVGKTQAEPVLNIQNRITLSVQQAKERWTNGLREKCL